MRLAVPLAIAVLAAALLAGCGGSSSSSGGSTQTGSTRAEGHGSSAPVGASARNCDTDATVDVEALRAVGVSCGRARQVMYGWQRNRLLRGPDRRLPDLLHRPLLPLPQRPDLTRPRRRLLAPRRIDRLRRQARLGAGGAAAKRPAGSKKSASHMIWGDAGATKATGIESRKTPAM